MFFLLSLFLQLHLVCQATVIIDSYKTVKAMSASGPQPKIDPTRKAKAEAALRTFEKTDSPEPVPFPSLKITANTLVPQGFFFILCS